MPAPFTIVTLTDDDGDEFPIFLRGVRPSNAGPDAKAALQAAAKMIALGDINPKGTLKLHSIEYK